MDKDYTKKLLLEGLDCASCADKIETQVSALPQVNQVIMNFMMKTLIIEFKKDAGIIKDRKSVV